jgi:hypothetical protein
MDAYYSSPHYQTLCERVGRLLAEYGHRLITDLPPAARSSGSRLRMIGPTVTHALKRLEFRALTDPEVLEAICAVTRDDPELAGFYHIFMGLKELRGSAD